MGLSRNQDTGGHSLPQADSGRYARPPDLFSAARPRFEMVAAESGCLVKEDRTPCEVRLPGGAWSKAVARWERRPGSPVRSRRLTARRSGRGGLFWTPGGRLRYHVPP